jgi:hypothetical protein
MEFLVWLEQSGFSVWMRESPSVWAYPTVLFLHTFGLALLVGASMVIDLRVLGFSQSLPLEPFRRFLPVMWLGFWTNAISGVALVVMDATTLLANPLFYIKLGFIALAVLCGRLIANRVFPYWPAASDADARTSSKVLAAASLLFWIGAITAGRLTAYLFTGADLAASVR